MTAHAMKGDRERCLAAGMDGYVSKPLRPQELFEVLEGLARGRSAADPAAAGSASAPPAFDLAAALDRVDGDVELMKELAGLFLDECPQRMAEIREAILRRDASGSGSGPRPEGVGGQLRGAGGHRGGPPPGDAGRKTGLGATWRRPGPPWRRPSTGSSRPSPRLGQAAAS